MACPTMSFNGITREVYDCLVKQAGTMGFPAPQSPSGRVAYHSVEADYRWEESEGTLEITITRAPDWLDCSMVESRVRQAMRACGAA
jgi:hypothetical protein